MDPIWFAVAAISHCIGLILGAAATAAWCVYSSWQSAKVSVHTATEQVRRSVAILFNAILTPWRWARSVFDSTKATLDSIFNFPFILWKQLASVLCGMLLDFFLAPWRWAASLFSSIPTTILVSISGWTSLLQRQLVAVLCGVTTLLLDAMSAYLPAFILQPCKTHQRALKPLYRGIDFWEEDSIAEDAVVSMPMSNKEHHTPLSFCSFLLTSSSPSSSSSASSSPSSSSSSFTQDGDSPAPAQVLDEEAKNIKNSSQAQKVPQLVSPLWDGVARDLLADHLGSPVAEDWEMIPCLFDSTYRQLAPQYPEALSLVGRGGFSQVYYAEKQDATESWVPCAVKRVRFHTKEEQALIQQELSALRAVQGAAHLIQYMSHAEIIIDSITYMYIVTRYIEGASIDSFLCQLEAGFCEPGGVQAYSSAVSTIFMHILEAVQRLHEAGYSHLDLKSANLCVAVGQDGSDPQAFVIDLGSCVHIATGPSEILGGYAATWEVASPEYIRREVFGSVEECIGGREHDYWSLGCILVYLLTCISPFSCMDNTTFEGSSDEMARPRVVHAQQLEWARFYQGQQSQMQGSLPMLVHYSSQCPEFAFLYHLAWHLLNPSWEERSSIGQAMAYLAGKEEVHGNE